MRCLDEMHLFEVAMTDFNTVHMLTNGKNENKGKAYCWIRGFNSTTSRLVFDSPNVTLFTQTSFGRINKGITITKLKLHSEFVIGMLVLFLGFFLHITAHSITSNQLAVLSSTFSSLILLKIWVAEISSILPWRKYELM